MNNKKVTSISQETNNKNIVVEWITKKLNPLYHLGFTQKKATVREFVILLVLGLLFYGYLHRKYPPSSPLSSKAKLARTEVLREISQQQEEIDNIALTLEASSAKETSTDPTTSESSSTDETSSSEIISSFPLTEDTIKGWRLQLEEFFRDRAQTQTSIEDILTRLENVNFAEITADDVTDIQKLLTNLQNLLEEDELFWSDNKKWFEVIFWSLFGTLCYVIQQTTDYFLREKYSNQTHETRAGNYLIRYKPKYYFYIFRSPLFTLIILFILSFANLDIVGVSLSLSTLGIPVLVALAFILGFANLVTTEQLNLIIAAIFKDAWQRTVRKIDIYPPTKEVEYGKSWDFQVVPDVKVKWSIWSKPPVGTIDAATGMFIAPPKSGYIYDEQGNLKKLAQEDSVIFKQVIIRAEREYEPSVSSLALVILIDEDEHENTKEKPEDTKVTNIIPPAKISEAPNELPSEISEENGKEKADELESSSENFDPQSPED